MNIRKNTWYGNIDQVRKVLLITCSKTPHTVCWLWSVPQARTRTRPCGSKVPRTPSSHKFGLNDRLCLLTTLRNISQTSLAFSSIWNDSIVSPFTPKMSCVSKKVVIFKRNKINNVEFNCPNKGLHPFYKLLLVIRYFWLSNVI